MLKLIDETPSIIKNADSNKKMQNKTYIVGEIGQNHNGSVDIAKSITDSCSKGIKEDVFGYKLNGLDAVKLTKET